MRDNRFLIITGMSGSGKTAVSRFLEDFGYYCMDNLPSKLIPSFVDLWMRKEVEIERVALVVDIREAGFIKEFPEILKTIRKKISLCLIFIDASDEVLVKRFNESRRPHPLAIGKSIIENVSLERKRLATIKRMADDVIDTSSTSISELKKRFAKKFLANSSQMMQVVIVSFGYKYGIPLESDIVLDTRFLPNPFYIDMLRNKTGKNDSVREYVMGSAKTRIFLDELYRFADYLMPNFVDEGKGYLTIAIGCTGGKHRSVVLADKLREHLRSKKYKTRIYHRDIHK